MKVKNEVNSCQEKNEEIDCLRQMVNSLNRQNKLGMLRWSSMRSENKLLKASLESANFSAKEEIHRLREELFWALQSQKQLKSELSELEASHTKDLEMANLDMRKKNVSLKERLDNQEERARNEKEAHQIEICKLSNELLRIQDSQKEMRIQPCQLKTWHARELKVLNAEKDNDGDKDDITARVTVLIKDQADHMLGEEEPTCRQLGAHFKTTSNLRDDYLNSLLSHKNDLLRILACLEALEIHHYKEVTSLAEQLTVLKLNTHDTHPEQSSCLSTIDEDVDIHTTEYSVITTCLRPEMKCPREKKGSLKTFAKTLKQLQYAVKPENIKYIVGKIKEMHEPDIEARVFEEIYHMTTLLGETYEADVALH